MNQSDRIWGGGVLSLRVKIRVEENIEEMHYLSVTWGKITALMIIGLLA